MEKMQDTNNKKQAASSSKTNPIDNHGFVKDSRGTHCDDVCTILHGMKENRSDKGERRAAKNESTFMFSGGIDAARELVTMAACFIACEQAPQAGNENRTAVTTCETTARTFTHTCKALVEKPNDTSKTPEATNGNQ